jgi:ATP phosphoribosyltransferase
VSDGNVDIGITGQDVVAESNASVHVLLNLGFGKCQLCIQTPIASPFTTAKDLIGKRIVTSFEVVAKRHLSTSNSNT